VQVLERVRTERNVRTSNARIKQLEAAGRGRPENVVQSLARQAKVLAYRVRMVLEPEEGGRTLEATLG
jgi:hypothetical protein